MLDRSLIHVLWPIFLLLWYLQSSLLRSDSLILCAQCSLNLKHLGCWLYQMFNPSLVIAICNAWNPASKSYEYNVHMLLKEYASCLTSQHRFICLNNNHRGNGRWKLHKMSFKDSTIEKLNIEGIKWNKLVILF